MSGFRESVNSWKYQKSFLIFWLENTKKRLTQKETLPFPKFQNSSKTFLHFVLNYDVKKETSSKNQQTQSPFQ